MCENPRTSADSENEYVWQQRPCHSQNHWDHIIFLLKFYLKLLTCMLMILFLLLHDWPIGERLHVLIKVAAYSHWACMQFPLAVTATYFFELSLIERLFSFVSFLCSSLGCESWNGVSLSSVLWRHRTFFRHSAALWCGTQMSTPFNSLVSEHTAWGAAAQGILFSCVSSAPSEPAETPALYLSRKKQGVMGETEPN